LKFLRQITLHNPQLRAFAQIKLYLDAIQKRNEVKNKLLLLTMKIE